MDLEVKEVERLRYFFNELTYISALAKGMIPGKRLSTADLSRLIDDELQGLNHGLLKKLEIELLFQGEIGNGRSDS